MTDKTKKMVERLNRNADHMEAKMRARAENCDLERLQHVIKTLNDTKLKGIDVLLVAGVNKDTMAINISKNVEDIAEKHGEESIPKEALLMYNDLNTEYLSPLDALGIDEASEIYRTLKALEKVVNTVACKCGWCNAKLIQTDYTRAVIAMHKETKECDLVASCLPDSDWSDVIDNAINHMFYDKEHDEEECKK